MSEGWSVLTPERLAGADDRDLMNAVRLGCVESFAELYQRHVAAALAYAGRLVTQNADAKDVVADVFLRVFGILSRGFGPQDSFRPYLMRAVRNAAYDRTRAQGRIDLTGDVSVLEGCLPFHDTAVERFDRTRAIEAFRSLPERWREVLWLTVIEECSVDEAAVRLGLNTNSLTSLAYRAREGLRQAYLRTSITGSGAECRRIAPAIVRYMRGSVSPATRGEVERHIVSCEDCEERLLEVRESDVGLYDPALLPIRAAKPRRSAPVARTNPSRRSHPRMSSRDNPVPA
jgi:RNA polymerase sigma factor (sigma-70 family)